MVDLSLSVVVVVLGVSENMSIGSSDGRNYNKTITVNIPLFIGSTSRAMFYITLNE